MKAIVYEGPQQIAVRDVKEPEVKEGRVLIRVCYAGICGTDMTIYYGKHPRAKAPLIPGHEFSGHVVCGGSKYAKGQLVTVYPYLECGHCECCERGDIHVCEALRLIGIDLDGGMAEYVLVPEDRIYAVPQGITPKLAAFIEPVGISVHAAVKGGYIAGKTAVVFGAGAIGLSCALTLRTYGAQKLLVCEPNRERNELAKQLGFDTVPEGTDTYGCVMEWTQGKGADFVYDCAGHQSVIDLLPDCVKINGRIVVVAGYKTPPTMNFQKGMFREFTIQFVRNCSRADFAKACELINGDYEKLLNCVLPIEKAQEGFDVPKGAYKVMFRLGEDA